jgi:hypothetical protein
MTLVLEMNNLDWPTLVTTVVVVVVVTSALSEKVWAVPTAPA